MKSGPSQKPPFFASRDIISKHGHQDRIGSYLRCVLEHNQKINLVSRETSYEDLLRIAADCLIPFHFLPPLSGKLFDIGPGAGFPSVVLMLAFPGAEGILFERTKKKAAFLHRMLRLFDLKGEVLDLDFSEAVRGMELSSFDYGFLKLVRPDRKLLSCALDLLKPSGRFIYFGSLEKAGLDLGSGLEADAFDYYLDDPEQLRSITAFSKSG
ncbi:MAG: class I SAM-dependent methyltransferase [Candidatus Zixiibacteriota bacterium]|nr:MAG: class I SAM-dependent methyltransferase [candidate division Zixibacteria bacterium]